MSPYRRPPISEDAARAIEEAIVWHRKVLEFQAEGNQAAIRRAGAVTRALQSGASLSEVATSLGISPEAVRQWGTNTVDKPLFSLKQIRLGAKMYKINVGNGHDVARRSVAASLYMSEEDADDLLENAKIEGLL